MILDDALGPLDVSPLLRLSRRWLPSALVLVASVSCFPMDEPSPGRAACLRSCAQQKDSCMIAATSADAIHACDTESRRCNYGCPS